MEKLTAQYDYEELRNEPLFSQAIQRLKAYEGTGVEPEDIISGEELAGIACAMFRLKQYQAIGTVEELAGWKQAETALKGGGQDG